MNGFTKIFIARKDLFSYQVKTIGILMGVLPVVVSIVLLFVNPKASLKFLIFGACLSAVTAALMMIITRFRHPVSIAVDQESMVFTYRSLKSKHIPMQDIKKMIIEGTHLGDQCRIKYGHIQKAYFLVEHYEDGEELVNTIIQTAQLQYTGKGLFGIGVKLERRPAGH